MSLLFDISPSEGGKRRPSKRAKSEAPPEAVFRHEPVAYKSAQPRIIRKVDGAFDCADGACGTQCHDVVAEEPGFWYLICAFCGTGQWVEAIPEDVKPEEMPADGVFRFGEGRFPGMTLDEVFGVKDGPEYLAWAAQHHKRPAVRDACKTYLDRLGAAR